ncbi:MAG: hypothetical protein JNJ61_07900, partial [Anaerolineae bacterium]|nr:hypothetical protein [Anaerolineae bacterium]
NNSARRSAAPLDGSGGALAFAQRARITIANSTFTGNSALGSSFNANGGAIYITNNSEQFQIINSTIANNVAGWVGGGVVNSALPGTTTPGGIIRNTIFANNTANNGGNGWNIQQHCSAITVGGGVIPPLTNGGNNLQFPDRNPSPNYWNETVCASGITIGDAQLGPLQDNGGPTQTRAPDLDSPAVDAGSNATCAAAPINNRDQRGQTRPIDGDGDANPVCDIGAYELVPNQPPFAPTLLTPADDALLTSNTPTFTWTRAPFATEYRLQVDDDPMFGSPALDVTLTGQSYTAPYLAIGGYSWQVYASNSFGNALSGTHTLIIASAENSAPQRNYVTQLDPTLSWTRVSWALGYWVRVDNNSNFSSPEFENTSVPADQTSVIANLPGDGIYYWQVCARPAPTTCGAWSTVETLVVDEP